MAIPLYHEYAPSHPRFRGHYRVTAVMAVVPVLAPLILMRAVGVYDPVFIGLAGLGAALLGLLIQAHRLDPRDPRCLAVTRARLAHRDQWFPPFMVVVQGLVTILTALGLWLAITRYLFEVRGVYSLFIVFLAILLPFRRYAAARQMAGEAAPSWFWEGISTAFTTALILLGAIVLGDASGEEQQPFVLVAWVVALVLILFRVLIAVHKLKL